MSDGGPPIQQKRAPDVRVDRWQNLVTGAFRLSEACEDGRPEAAARDYLNNVLEVFGAEADPVDDWEGYAVRRMALSLQEALDAISNERQAK